MTERLLQWVTTNLTPRFPCKVMCSSSTHYFSKACSLSPHFLESAQDSPPSLQLPQILRAKVPDGVLGSPKGWGPRGAVVPGLQALWNTESHLIYPPWKRSQNLQKILRRLESRTFLQESTRALVQLIHLTKEKNEMEMPCELKQVTKVVNYRIETTAPNPKWYHELSFSPFAQFLHL